MTHGAVEYDFRSDTVTLPSIGMRAAMIDAEVGDDVFGEDPTVVRLEQHVAQMLGKEASIFCTSGTLANQLACRVHLSGGGPYSVLCYKNSHVAKHESGALSMHCGAEILRHESFLTPDIITNIIRNSLGNEMYVSPVRLMVLEAPCDGDSPSVADIKELSNAAKVIDSVESKVRVHLDGARIWHLPEKPSAYAQHVDTISVCFSKSLGAPIGSALCGSHKDIARARVLRKLMGGGWRQAGMLAAAVLYTLKDNRVKELVGRANNLMSELVYGIKNIPISQNIRIRLPMPKTNILFLQIPKDSVSRLKELERKAGIFSGFISPLNNNFVELRIVTHPQLANDAITKLINQVIKHLN